MNLSGYRPEIDGLRAIAVMLVLLFHAGLYCSGGYIGVDVFFVISGYLITSLLIRDIQKDRFSMIQFYERRARRIAPAAFAVTLFTLAVGVVLLLSSDFASLSESALAQTIFGANIYFWLSADYFSGPSELLPLLHMWSLAVEEQFYLIFPIFLYVAYRIFQGNCHRILQGILFIAGLSFALSLYLTPRNPEASFYLPFTRAWELMVGSTISLAGTKLISGKRIVREVVSISGMICIALPALLYTHTTLFPGFSALPVCLGTGLVIWSLGGLKESDAKPIIYKILISRPFVFIGLISYSLYLWHWPVFAFSRYWSFMPWGKEQILILLAVSFILAVLSWRFIEQPFRTRRLSASRKSMFALTGTGSFLIAFCSLVFVASKGWPSRFSTAEQQYLSAVRTSTEVEVELSDALVGKFPVLGDTSNGDPVLLVWGDSHCQALCPAFDAGLKELGASGFAATHQGTPPLLDFVPRSKWGIQGEDGKAFNQAIFDHIIKKQIMNVFLVSAWPANCNYLTDRKPIIDATVRTIERLRANGVNVWLVRDIPRARWPVPKTLVGESRLGFSIPRTDKITDKRYQSSAAGLYAAAEDAGAYLVDLSTSFFDPQTGSYRIEHDGQSLYVDSSHLSHAGANLAKNSLMPILGRIVTDTKVKEIAHLNTH